MLTNSEVLMFWGTLLVPSSVKQFKKKNYLPLEDGADCPEMSVIILQSVLCIITEEQRS